ncbi:MAG TPA: hypothetical protein VLL06_10140, partial [Nitrospiraceae bacterium]|nr:hypothetical protein [Nitrospiraceae bacterium]
MTFYPLFIVTIFASLFGIGSVEAAGLDALQQVVGQRASGLITGLSGAPVLGSVGGLPRDAVLGQTVTIADGVTTGPNDRVEILWDRRAVILVQPDSKVLIQESKAGQTDFSLSGGSIRVALAYGGASTDMVTVQTPSSRVYTRGGIFEVDVRPPMPSFIARVVSALSPPISHAPVETVRVHEGQSGIEPGSAPTPGGSHMLEAGVLARIAMGIVEQVEALPKTSAKGLGLAETDRQQATPALLTQRLVNIHVTHAVEVARVMSTPSTTIDETAATPGSTLKGTIVATSLGVPSIPNAQAGTTKGVAPGSPPAASVTSPVPTRPPMQVPPITRPPNGLSRHALKEGLGDEDKHSHQSKGHDRNQDSSAIAITSPLPTLLGVPPSTNTPLTSTQTVGPASSTVLKNVLDDGKSGGTHHSGGTEQVSSNPVMTSPIPTLPAIEIPTTTTMAPSQAGGFNSHQLLKDAFDLDKGGGKEKHQGGDRH